MPEATALRDLQAWVQAAIVGPGRDLPAAEVERVLRPSARLTARERLDLYRRSYRLRLLEAMRASYPGLRHLLGHDLFDEFALDYLVAHPSRSYTLLRLGEGFPAHLEATRPAPDEAGGDWPELVVDLARLERAFAEVYDGPGVEGEWLPAAGDLPDHPGDPRAAAEPVPCLRPMRFSFPVAPYLEAVRRGGDPPLPEPGESFLALCRRDYVVTMTPLDARQHAALERLVRGEPLGSDWPLVRRFADAGFLRRPGPEPPHRPHPTHEERVTP
ncbi:MAG TPA: DNA-binding domain-containing protein [Thermoleophilaceae bacterium]